MLNSPEKYSYLPEHKISRTFLFKKKKDINCMKFWFSYIFVTVIKDDI